MDTAKPTIIVTGVSGNLGQRLLPQLADYTVVGIDVTPPTHSPVDRFVPLDLGREESTRDLLLLLREVQPASVVHLAFVIDPQRSGVLDVDRMWRINVAGTARVMEAITEANRNTETTIRQFIFPSSVSAYGSDLPAPVAEDSPLGAHTLPYAIHKKESDLVVQQRAPSLRGCGVFILRPHIFAGATVENYLMGAFRGTPNGKGSRAARMRQAAKRLPCMLPFGQKYLDNKIQFVHVDDMARLIAWILTAGTGSAAADHPERCRTWRSFDLRAVYRNGARQIAARARTVGHAPRSAILVELEHLCDSAGRRPLHDRPVHHEHRPAEEISRRRLRAGD